MARVALEPRNVPAVSGVDFAGGIAASDAAVGQACVRAANALGLVFTSVDVRVNEAGEPFVLECNPTPSVAFYEAPEKSPILRALAAHLLAHA